MKNFSLYNVDFISRKMSLRKPQKDSLEILENILTHVKPTKNMNLDLALEEVKKIYPICTNFERKFMSLSFVLATGVGKTRLMGAFITYLYTVHNLKNFFVVAPNTTIYNKLKDDLGNPMSEKYVFRGLDCFVNLPEIITDDSYKVKPFQLFERNIKIYIYNIDKFNAENTRMRKMNEILGNSFYKYLSKLDDLVMIMDEAHHYHAEKSSNSLNDLKPILGLELTATAYYNNDNKQVPFKNAVYEYPLSQSIKDGYTRTPYALTQQNIDFYNFGEEELDKIMILDGLKNHENIKKELEIYSKNNKKRIVKPFVMIVCKDTEHAEKINCFIKSEACKNGLYKDKTLLIHTKQKKSEREPNIQLLLNVEKSDNPIEIVIHVDMLKEGWDVNNLYTIIPLRTAASRILREQMVGRGLRLPFGKRTGEKYIDAVMLTAHGKFEDILKEAKKEDSIFKAGNVIYANELDDTEESEEQTQMAINFKLEDDEVKKILNTNNLAETKENKEFIIKSTELIKEKTEKILSETENRKENISQEKVKSEVLNSIETNEDLVEIYKKNSVPFYNWLKKETEEIVKKTMDNFIPIPLIKITDEGVEEYKFVDFNLDFTFLDFSPIKNNIIFQNLENLEIRDIIKGESINFDVEDPLKEILKEIIKKPEVDYEKSSEILYKVIKQLISYYEQNYTEDEIKNIIMMNKKKIAKEIHRQMFLEEHFYYSRGMIEEKIIDVSRMNKLNNYKYKYKTDLYEGFKEDIKKNLFMNIKKGVYTTAKFDSEAELKFARILEYDKEVIRWLRPHISEFNLFYNRNKRYEPDFVVETKDIIYLVEIKGEDKINDADVIAKKERAIKYCKISSTWAKINGYKEWKHLFIPAGLVKETTSFELFKSKFVVGE